MNQNTVIAVLLVQFHCVHYGVVLNYVNPQISGLSNPLKHTRTRKNLREDLDVLVNRIHVQYKGFKTTSWRAERALLGREGLF